MLFDETSLRKLQQLTLVTSRVRAGALRGERRSLKRGAGLEFADFRDYVPGDDLRRDARAIGDSVGGPELQRQQGEQGGAQADENVGAKPRRLVMQLTFEPDQRPGSDRAYELQDAGQDTVEANLSLGFEADLRQYECCVDILKHLGLRRIRLMSNNPDKIAAVERAGIEIVERVSIEVEPHEKSLGYMKTKKEKLGHLLDNVGAEDKALV